MTAAEAPAWLGRRVPRIEDAALLRGRGQFVGDIVRPGMLHARFVRSPVAHGRLLGLEVEAARRAPGVRGVFTAEDFRPHLTSPELAVAMPAGAIRYVVNPRVLAADEVCYAGEAVALVVADTPHAAEDAAALVRLDIELLPPALDPGSALEPGAPRARLGCADNLLARFTVAYGEVAPAFEVAPHVFRDRFHLHKGGGHSVETRGVLAEHDRVDDMLTVWSSAQMPHRNKGVICAALGRAEDRVRVVAPDVGGGFGPKFVCYPEDVAVPLAALLLGRPVRWIEDRRENFAATTAERDQLWDVEVAADAQGRLLGLRGRLLHDHGADTPYGIALPQNSATNLLGPYVLPAYRLEISVALTNKVAATPTRGAGRPQGTFVMERMLDRIADELGIERAEVRRRNLIPPLAMPYRTPLTTRDGAAMIYDSGDYPACMADALRLAGYEDFRARQKAAREAGRHIGIGLSNYVEGTSRGPFETAAISIGPSGQVVLSTGASAQGQGTATVLAQVCAGVLDMDPARITVRTGDTAAIAQGLGAFASRQGPVAGAAVLQAARLVREKALLAASHLLEAAPEDLELVNGAVRIRGIPADRLSLGQVAQVLQGMPGFPLPPGLSPGLSSSVAWQPEALSYANGTHVAEAMVDPETGRITLLRYLVVHDSGRLLNPSLAEGQILGGVVHGIGHALLEETLFDAQGVPATLGYPAYRLPSAPILPWIEIHHRETPTPLNPLGAKGVGEGGTIPAAAAIVAAVEDALRPARIRITQLPITPRRLRTLLAAA
ncbi:xanthine dehydrogenase family protein molybdopterin-binding subunit [Muricoccus aerilatus]|uniref:xanthine dehydrogenase family protein molybdopterin-binding subunit n=1 Tax=Muricoccus aerilatus TaxID=452982 RepID=UPI0005C21AFC|nr:xanthine dehydrogenase family protein molybdopterin-binding subunit [Roseomonas aerilata]